jgi:hypothetical protein
LNLELFLGVGIGIRIMILQFVPAAAACIVGQSGIWYVLLSSSKSMN